MLEYNSMVARFSDPEILKLIINKNTPGTFYIVRLDEDGEEYTTTVTPGMPMLDIKLVNNSSHKIEFPVASIGAYGLIQTYAVLEADKEMDVSTLLGTPDGNNYLIPVNAPIGVSYAVTDTVNCVKSSDFIIATDIDLDTTRSCTITFTDS